MASGLDHLLSNLGYLKRQEDNICRAMYGAPMNQVIAAFNMNALRHPTQPVGPQDSAYSVDSELPSASNLQGFKRQVFEAVSNGARKMTTRDIANAKRNSNVIEMHPVGMQGGDDGMQSGE